MPDATAIKSESERVIIAAGGKINDGLPYLDVEMRALRSKEEVLSRALAMNALINVAFNAPVPVVADWIRRNQVEHALSPRERSILARSRDELSRQELIDLHWYLESLWTLMWAGNLVTELPFDRGVPEAMASLCPDLEKNEDGAKFEKLRLRSFDETFSKLDLYFRLHWYARDGSLRGSATPPVELSVITERRKALEWLLDPRHDWDSVQDGT